MSGGSRAIRAHRRLHNDFSNIGSMKTTRWPVFPLPFRYHFCQREAIETLVWLVEIVKTSDAQALIKQYATIFRKDLLSQNIEFQTTMDGRRQCAPLCARIEQSRSARPAARRPAEVCIQDGHWLRQDVGHGDGHRLVPLSQEDRAGFRALHQLPHRRAQCHRLSAAGEGFCGNRIFYELPLIPPEWRANFSQRVILRGEVTEPDASGNLFLTNIHQLYELRETNGPRRTPSRRCSGEGQTRTLGDERALDAGARQIA